MFFKSFFCSLLLASGVAAAPKASTPSLSKRCTNSADDRTCWGDYDISTNYYDEVPDTGVTREYWWDIVNVTAAPDGVERFVLAINGSIPGPTIIADWGDTVVVHLTNSMENNGTSIHFHGIRQNFTIQNDGVSSVTQCPIPPGGTYTYTWRATQYGSSWYHSHFAVQAWDGIFGGILINGPATANYDEDLGNLFLNDWYHLDAATMAVRAEHGPPKLNNGLINGTNVYDDGGSRFETTFEAGKRYRLRLVNAAADTVFRFAIDNHTLEVIAADFVPIVPYTTDVLAITMGQRYDVIVTANATEGTDFWMRAVIQDTCSNNENSDNVRGIVRYDASSTSDPTTTAWPAANVNGTCYDEDMSDLVPYVAINPSDADVTDNFDVQVVSAGSNTFLWKMGSHTFINLWEYPSLQQLNEGNDSWTEQQQVYEVPDADQWVYFIIQEPSSGVPHPMHLHGHDFWVLGQGTGTYDSSTVSLNMVNPPRRDVVQLPGNGYVVIAFKSDNPGIWTVHCHIAWHLAEGLAIQILERESEIAALIDQDQLDSTCAAWDAYVSADNIVQTDSGI